MLGDHYAAVVHPGDDDTFSVALMVLAEDEAMRVLREPATFTAVALATPGVADWLGPGMSTPITDVRAITCPPTPSARCSPPLAARRRSSSPRNGCACRRTACSWSGTRGTTRCARAPPAVALRGRLIPGSLLDGQPN